MKALLILFIASIIFVSCRKEERCNKPRSENYFAFGTASGRCLDDCTQIYQVKNGNLFPDEMERLTDPLKFGQEKLADDKYEMARKLKDNFPQYLKDRPDQTFGCPDCADQGTIYIETFEDGVKRSWRIDTQTQQLPQEIRDYVEELRVVMEGI